MNNFLQDTYARKNETFGRQGAFSGFFSGLQSSAARIEASKGISFNSWDRTAFARCRISRRKSGARCGTDFFAPSWKIIAIFLRNYGGVECLMIVVAKKLSVRFDFWCRK